MDLPKPVTSGTYFLWRFLIAAFVLVSAASIFPAQRTSSSEPGDGTASPLFQQALPNVDGKMFSSLIVDLPPGGRAAPHRYGQSFVYAYVLDGAARTRLEDEPVRTYHEGESWFEAPDAQHVLTENASATESAKLLVVFVSDTDDVLKVSDGKSSDATVDANGPRPRRSEP